MKIDKSEAEHLSNLWDRANKNGSSTDWKLIEAYMKRLGSRYKFNPLENSISSKGYIHKLKYCSKCNGLATGINGTDYVRYRVTGTSKWAKQPVCAMCVAKYFPEFHKVENF